MNELTKEDLDFGRDFYKRAQDNVINYANKMDGSVNWAITLTGILIGLQWSILPYQIFLYLAEFTMIVSIIYIDSFRYQNFYKWRYILYKIQDNLNKNNVFGIKELDPNSYTKSTIKRYKAIFKRLYRVYIWLFLVIWINSFICFIINIAEETLGYILIECYLILITGIVVDIALILSLIIKEKKS